jgi:hypothetical protein
MRRAFVALVFGLVASACGDAGPPAGGGGANVTTAVPPISVVWFGSAFDPATFALTDKTGAVKQGAPLVAVGHLFAARDPDGVSVQISTGGSVRQTLPVAVGPGGPQDVYGADLTSASLGPATYIVSFVDKRGSVLASGNLNVTP